MITTLSELMEYRRYEKPLYPNTLADILTCDQRTYNWKYVKLLRWCEYFYNNRRKTPLHAALYIWFRRRKNILGSRIGVEIWENSFGKGLVIHHNGNIVINRGCRIGEDCELHGDNCMGNIGWGHDCPTLGDRVNVGVGAKILGGVTIADDVKIGANAVVLRDCERAGATLVGMPAREVEKK